MAGSMATAEEVLAFLSDVLRGAEPGGASAMKAAELLGKRLGLFSESEEALPTPVIVDDVDFRASRESVDGGGDAEFNEGRDEI